MLSKILVHHVFFFVLATGKLDISIQPNRRLPCSRKTKSKKNSSSTIEEAKKLHKMSKRKRNPPESPNTSARPQNMAFDDTKINEKIDGENELDDENEMFADGKLFNL